MKLLHFADFHLGMENYGTVDSQTGLPSRYGDFLRSFDVLIDTAQRERVDAVLFAGDAFKTRDPTPTQQREFAKRILVLAKQCPVVLLVGNHDLPTATARADALSIYDTLEIPNVTVLSRIKTVTIETPSGPLQVIGLPWIVRSHFLTIEEYKDLALADVNTKLAEVISGLIERQVDALDPAQPAVLVAHGSVTGAVYGSERSIMLGSDVPLPLGSLANEKLQYIALGHIHRHQVLNARPPVLYSGSMERIDFGEEAEPKGFILAEIAVGQETRWEHVATPAREFLTIDVHLADDEEQPMERILAAIAARVFANKVVRVRLDLPSHLRGHIDDLAIRRALADASYIAGIEKAQRVSPLVRRPDLIALEETPLQALERYLELKKTPAKRREQLLKLAESLVDKDTDATPPAEPSA